MYRDMTSSFGGTPPLNVGAGYGVVLGFGVFFSLFASFATFLDTRYAGTVSTRLDSALAISISSIKHKLNNKQIPSFISENFNTAGRNVGTGLTACVICSSWTWAATILQSSNVAYQYGISGPFWYASGATVQILLFGVLAIEVKRKAKNAHTGKTVSLNLHLRLDSTNKTIYSRQLARS